MGEKEVKVKVVDGCTAEALTQKAIFELLREGRQKPFSINRMPGIEARVLSAWVSCGKDANLLLREAEDLVRLLKQNTGFYAKSNVAVE